MYNQSHLNMKMGVICSVVTSKNFIRIFIDAFQLHVCICTLVFPRHFGMHFMQHTLSIFHLHQYIYIKNKHAHMHQCGTHLYCRISCGIANEHMHGFWPPPFCRQLRASVQQQRLRMLDLLDAMTARPDEADLFFVPPAHRVECITSEYHRRRHAFWQGWFRWFQFRWPLSEPSHVAA